jgi:hypothetical protein
MQVVDYCRQCLRLVSIWGVRGQGVFNDADDVRVLVAVLRPAGSMPPIDDVCQCQVTNVVRLRVVCSGVSCLKREAVTNASNEWAGEQSKRPTSYLKLGGLLALSWANWVRREVDPKRSSVEARGTQ